MTAGHVFVLLLVEVRNILYSKDLLVIFINLYYPYP